MDGKPVVDLELDPFTLEEMEPGAIVFYGGEPHTITKVEPLSPRPRMPYEGVRVYDKGGWGHVILVLDCTNCGTTKAFPGFDAMDKSQWFRMWARGAERFFCQKECIITYIEGLEER